MANEKEDVQAAAPPKPAKTLSVLLLVVAGLLVLQTAGGVWMWHRVSTKAVSAPGTTATTATTAQVPAAEGAPAPARTACPRNPFPEKEIDRVALEPFLVNLGDGGEKYLRASVTIAVHKDPKARDEAETKGVGQTRYAPARDTILGVLTRQDAAPLLTADGKSKLKADLLTALASDHPELQVVDVYFTDFLVQS